jgi:transcriptional regulator with XRE-family HTH domain
MGGIGETIRAQRKMLGMSQGKLAVAVGVNPKTVINWEKGYAAPEGKYLPKLSEALRLRLEDLAGYSPERSEINDKASLLDWATHQTAVLTNGLDNYLQAVIDAEVERRLAESRRGPRVRVIPLDAKLYDQIVREARYQAAAGEPIAFMRADVDADYLYFGEGYQHPAEEPPQEFGEP